MKYGEMLMGTITRFDAKGRGVFEIARSGAPNKAISVPFTTIGDQVEARFIKHRKDLNVAELTRVVTPGPSRMPYPSAATERFPGGLWMHIAYDAQVRFKEEMINTALADAGHAERIAQIIPSSITTHYRNRMDYAVSWDGKIGLKEFGSWAQYRDVTEDPLLSPAATHILAAVRPFLQKIGDGEPTIHPWDNRSYEGDLRYVVVREGKNTGDRMIGLIVKDLSRISEQTRAALRAALDPYATAIVLGENPLITDLSIAQTTVVLKGDVTFAEIVGGTSYRIHLNAFFQTNSAMAAVLQDTVANAVQAAHPASILDLYCGLGFFGINLAQRIPSLRVAGFEIDAQAIALATQNATLNSVADRCAFASGPAEDLRWKDTDADVVIIDPPRSGLHPRVLKTLLEKKPATIVYISCNYHRLVEELTQFKTAYQVESLMAVDLFPHTPHVEVVSVLKRVV
ncbi:MAG: hypothetical protein RL141_1046 [Candidatus Parcubacteria bacterium]|jgi:23S rRNA (uracil-5-)-methyltransferase RumA